MKYLFVLCCVFMSSVLLAQPGDEEVLAVVEKMPIFPGCEDLADDRAAQKECGDKKMLEFIYSNIKYPEVDRLNGNEGTAVISFIVEKDGSITNPVILKDPGEEMGKEAVRVVELMNELPQKWSPGIQKGVPVRVQFNLPVKFKLEGEVEPDFVISRGDSIWVKYDTPASYIGGDSTLSEYIEKSIKYPNKGQDSCRIGIVELSILVKQDGSADVTDVVDYSSLGLDYQFEAIRVINSTAGNWNPATLGDRKVNTSQSLRIPFTPNSVTCGERIHDFEKADQLVNNATMLMDESKMEESIVLLNEAVDLFPENGEFLSLRGQVYLNMKMNKEACIDFRKARDILVVSWFDGLLPFLCK